MTLTFFAGVASDLEPLNDELLVQLNSDCCSEYILEPWQVAIKLSRIQLSKSPGPDNIPNWLLKEMAPLLADPICPIFNASVRHVLTVGNLPMSFLFLRSIHPKIYAVTCDQFHWHQLWQKKLWIFCGGALIFIEDKLGRDQFGALKRRSTAYALISMTHIWSCALDTGDSARVLFIDYTKAFDHVDHTVLLTN